MFVLNRKLNYYKTYYYKEARIMAGKKKLFLQVTTLLT